MNTIIHDDCMRNLFYAQETMKNWIPMTDYEVLFVAVENTDVAEKVQQNEATAKKSVGFLQKAIDAVIKLIRNIIDAIRELIVRCTLKGDERKEFEAFKKQIAADPTLKNKKVSVMDFKKINKQYEDVLADIDKNIRELKANAEHPIDALVHKVTDFLKGAGSKAAMVVTADAALKMADSDVGTAKALQKLLEQEEGVMEGLSKALGKKGANAFKKDIDAAAKNTWLHRLKVKVRKRQFMTLRETIGSTIRALTAAGFKSAKDIDAAKDELKEAKASGVISKEEYKESMKELNALKKQVRREKMDSLALYNKLIKIDEVKPVAKIVAKAAVEAKINTSSKHYKEKFNDLVLNYINLDASDAEMYAQSLAFLTK